MLPVYNPGSSHYSLPVCKLCGAKGTETFTSGNPLGHDFSNNAEVCRREGCNEKNPDYKPATPVIIEGAGGEWTKESGATLRFRSDAGISSFLRVEVDGTVVDAKNYTVTEGSTIVTCFQYFCFLCCGLVCSCIITSICCISFLRNGKFGGCFLFFPTDRRHNRTVCFPVARLSKYSAVKVTMGETKKGRMYMKQKKKSLFSLFLALMMVAGLKIGRAHV